MIGGPAAGSSAGAQLAVEPLRVHVPHALLLRCCLTYPRIGGHIPRQEKKTFASCTAPPDTLVVVSLSSGPFWTERRTTERMPPPDDFVPAIRSRECIPSMDRHRL